MLEFFEQMLVAAFFLPQIKKNVLFINIISLGMIWKQCFPELSFACLLHWLSSAERETGLARDCCALMYYETPQLSSTVPGWGQVKVGEMTSCLLLPKAWYPVSAADSRPSEFTKSLDIVQERYCFVWLCDWSRHPD